MAITERIEKKPKMGKPFEEEFIEEELVRILSTDIPGDMSVYSGLTRIKGVSWTFSNAVCYSLSLDKAKKISDLNAAEIEKINSFLKNPKVPQWILNRRNDRETGESKQILLTDLDVSREWDIRRMKKIKSYRGWRHSLGQPVRGQRTKNHFRGGTSMGVKKGKEKSAAKAAAPAAGAKKK